MHVIRVRNVAEALPAGLLHLQRVGRWEDTRAGRALVAPEPVTTVYARPRERVLFSTLRDANPFFHACEAMWMIAGRRDAGFLNNFVRDFGARFAEPDLMMRDADRLNQNVIHDAYGHRWRHAFGFDQLDAVVRQLTESPGSRQAVIQMWDCRGQVGTDHFGQVIGERDLTGGWKTRPCNLVACLRINSELLDLTVFCRSNDLVWGLAGANAVHFSVLQEYLAARLDVGVGTYTQIANNLHAYEDQLLKLLGAPAAAREGGALCDDRYTRDGLEPQPLVHDVETFDQEVRWLLKLYEGREGDTESAVNQMNNPFLSRTVWPMMMAHRDWRDRRYAGMQEWAGRISSPDWQVASQEWLTRRLK